MAWNISRRLKQDAVYGVTTTTAKTFYGDKVDTANFDDILFTACFKSTGASTGHCTWTVVGTETSTAASTSYTALTGASVTVENSTTAGDKRIASIEIYRPQHRYLRTKMVKQAGILLNSIICQKFSERVEPAAASTTYAGGTAALSKVLAVGATTST